MERGTRSLSEEEAERVRTHLRELTQRRGEQAALAKRMGLTPQAISSVVRGDSEPGVNLARALADHLNIALDELLGKTAAEPEREPRLGSLPGWAVAEASARRRFKFVPEEAWEIVRNIRTAQPPSSLTADWIGDLASTWARVLKGTEE